MRNLDSSVLALCCALSATSTDGALRGSQTLEKICAGVGVPPPESKRYDFYLGLSLCRASELGRVQCVRAILELTDPPVDVAVADAAGLTALAHAASQGEAETFALLLPKADVRCESWACAAPLCLSSDRGFTPLVVALLDARSVVDARDPSGRTPLHLASASGHVAIVEALLRAGASVAASTPEDGRRALHRAASRGHAEVVGALLAARASRLDLDAWNRTAWELAEEQRHHNVLDLLQSDKSAVARPVGLDEELRLEKEKLFALQHRLGATHEEV
mmetsp:Transcript_111587/g.315104  ORF Transcript_111587/g.315104 Transcript_111587/m.315104 type:complete len:277 (-) Transcript_111587:263-1093(-)|eukprot:CAMPEP_0117508310 /NCGR_PEP_ID=MMETSP0784-20121206/26883_1 /TAXON_ID=39447 /ORGANISM="" /LENGTH=276 /DNA_ID=CAMNT_0005303861 /DNA_START=67 /DNA_END=897 /DNA_ORIENTATION=-